MEVNADIRSAIAAVLLCTAGLAAASAATSAQQRQQQLSAVSVEQLVAAAIAGDQARLHQVAVDLRARPRPPRGDRRVARDLNERGLAQWRRQRFEEAAVYFRQAHDADPSDAEIVENLGYSLLRAGHTAEAEPAILTALSLAPERASAWGSLGLLRAKSGKHAEGVACVLTAFRFARDQKRTLDVYSRLASTHDDPKVRAMLSDVVSRISVSYPEPKRG